MLMVVLRSHSGGTDETILKYDVSHMRTVAAYPPNPGSPIEVNRDHDVCHRLPLIFFSSNIQL